MTEVDHNKTDIDEDIANALKTLKRAAKIAQEKAKQYGHGVIIYKDDHIVEWLPEAHPCTDAQE